MSLDPTGECDIDGCEKGPYAWWEGQEHGLCLQHAIQETYHRVGRDSVYRRAQKEMKTMNPGKAVEQQIGKLMRPERMELCRVLGGIEALHKLVSMGKDIPREKLKDWCERHMSNITQTLEAEGDFGFLEEEE